MRSEIPEIELPVLVGRFDSTIWRQLEALLPSYVRGRRWFRAKARQIERVAIEDALPIPDQRTHLLILKIEYPDAEPERYLLPVSIADMDGERDLEALASFRTKEGENGVVYSALHDREFRDTLLKLIANGSRLNGQLWELQAANTGAFPDGQWAVAPQNLESIVSRAEQSNTSIIYRGEFILKLFRKLEAGINPDIEIGTFLTQHGFAHTPAALGSMQLRPKDDDFVYAAAILQKFVPNQGDAWKYTLDSLADFFPKVLSLEAEPPALSGHPLEQMETPIPTAFRSLLGPYLESAELLGRRTAQMHAALAGDPGNPDFAPEPVDEQNRAQLREELTSQADVAFRFLRETAATLAGSAADDARELLRREPEIYTRLLAIEDQPIQAVRIRHHGDYHLGQVLFTGTDFMIIDFEGEPARTLAERRRKALALRDVAGMLRSFQYAAYAVLFGQVPGVPLEPESVQRIESWAGSWNAAVSRAYLKAYFEEAGTRTFVPRAQQERRLLLDAFLLQKALYEVAYELNNRPDWVRIPLRGILTLVS